MDLSWTLVRPSSTRAAAIVFVFAIADPGAPLVLGLRRTLAFQLVEAARRPDPFPQAAVWALAVGLFGLIGWLIWRWAGGTPITMYAVPSTHPRRRPHRRRSRSRSVFLLAACAFLGWLPVAGLVKLSLGESRSGRVEQRSVARDSGPVASIERASGTGNRGQFSHDWP